MSPLSMFRLVERAEKNLKLGVTIVYLDSNSYEETVKKRSTERPWRLWTYAMALKLSFRRFEFFPIVFRVPKTINDS